MSLDLFFVPRKPTFEERRCAAFAPTPATTRFRRKVLTEFPAAYPGASLEGDINNGRIANFSGDMDLHPGYIFWSQHGVTDVEPVHAVVKWFHAHGFVCEDPQDAGFGNRDLKSGEERVTLHHWEELIGSAFIGIRLLPEWSAGIAMEWTLADGSHAVVQFVRFELCQLPDLGLLLTRKVISTSFQTCDPVTLLGFDTLRVLFEGDLELLLEGGVFQKSVVTRKT